MSRKKYVGLGVLSAVLATVLAVSLACASADPTATPAAPAQPDAPVAPTTMMAAPTATLAPGQPTPIPARPTATRVLPTATPVAMMSGPQHGGDLRFAYALLITTMDPHYSNDVSERPIFYSMYNTLVQYGTDFSINPELAERWAISDDGKKVTFFLQEEVKFHNGDEFDANTVKWNYDRLLNTDDPLPLSGQVQFALDNVTVVDKHTVDFNMKFPYRPLMSDLGERPGFIVPPGPIEELGSGYPFGFGSHDAGGTYSLSPVGTGPFMFKEWLPGLRVVLEQNEDYWESGRPYLDSISYMNIEDGSVRLAMIRTNEVDIISNVRVQDIPLLEDHPSLRTTSLVTGKWHGIRSNINQAPYDNQKLRNAMAYAIDRETVARTYFGGAASPAYLSEGNSWAWDSEVRPFEYNVERARQTLTEAGFPNGIDVDIWCSSTVAQTELCEVYQAMMEPAGIRLNIIPVIPADSWRGFIDGRYHFAPTTWRPRADPHGRLVRIYHPEGQSNVPKYNNARVGELLDEAVQQYDIATAKPLYLEAQQTIAETGWHIYVIYETVFAAAHDKVQDFQLYPDLMQRFRWLWFEQ